MTLKSEVRSELEIISFCVLHKVIVSSKSVVTDYVKGNGIKKMYQNKWMRSAHFSGHQ